jgi:hypothetical protein
MRRVRGECDRIRTVSWDVTNEQREVCPCGKGEYIRTTEQNAWFQTQESEQVTCAECAKRYRYVYGRWMTSEELNAYNSEREAAARRAREEQERVSARAEEERERRLELLRQELGPPLFGALAHLRSRKATYDGLCKLVPEAPTFTSFNALWISRGRDYAILYYATWRAENEDALRRRFGLPVSAPRTRQPIRRREYICLVPKGD